MPQCRLNLTYHAAYGCYYPIKLLITATAINNKTSHLHRIDAGTYKVFIQLICLMCCFEGARRKVTALNSMVKLSVFIVYF